MTQEEINYSKHVEQRIEERKLEKQWIVETVLNPDKTIVKAENEVHYFKKFIELAGKFLTKCTKNPLCL